MKYFIVSIMLMLLIAQIVGAEEPDSNCSFVPYNKPYVYNAPPIPYYIDPFKHHYIVFTLEPTDKNIVIGFYRGWYFIYLPDTLQFVWVNSFEGELMGECEGILLMSQWWENPRLRTLTRY